MKLAHTLLGFSLMAAVVPSALAQDVPPPEEPPAPRYTPPDVPFRVETYYLSFGRKNRATSGALGYRRGNIGFELGLVDRAELNPFQLFDGFPPPDVRTIGVFNTGPLIGVDALYYTGKPMDKFSLFVGVGFYTQSRSLIGQAPGTTAYFTLGERSDVYFAGSVGFQALVGRNVTMGASYHSERGVQFSLGFRAFRW